MSATPLSAQEMFTKVATHLLRQGKRAEVTVVGGDEEETKACRYRTPYGLKCAIGCLIADEDYRPSFEGFSPLTTGPLESRELCNVAGITHSTEDLARLLQSVHDSYGPDQWPNRLREVANDHSLQMPEGP